jgi:hypothetical protein
MVIIVISFRGSKIGDKYWITGLSWLRSADTADIEGNGITKMEENSFDLRIFLWNLPLFFRNLSSQLLV